LIYRFEDYVFDTARRELRRGVTVVPVEPQVFDLLAYLIANRERVVSKEDLLAAVWQGRTVSESTLSSSINAVRAAIGDNGEDQRVVRTLPRKGFRFVAVVTEQEAPARPAAEVAGSAGKPLPAQSGQPQFTEATAVLAPVAGARHAGPVSGRTFVISTGAGLLAVAAILLWFLWPTSDPLRRAPPVASGQTFDASIVPLVDDEARRTLAGYPNRPDFKALAITGGFMAVAEGEVSAEAARQDALRRCTARANRQCRLYAVGMNVVWSGEAMPLTAASDLRFEPLGIPLVPDEIPTLDRDRQDRIATQMQGADHKALAITTRGSWVVNSRATRAEAVRLAVERCAEFWQRPCLILAVDGLLTIQIPKSRQVARIFLPSTEAELAGDDKERIGRIYQGAEWRALARGKNGSWHAVAAAPSEEAAVAAALRSCSQTDQECRLHAIGNFRVLGE